MSPKANTIRSPKPPSSPQFRFFPLLLLVVFATGTAKAQTVAADPGVRGGSAGAGKAIAGLTDAQKAFFAAAFAQFNENQSVTGAVPNTSLGLGQDSTGRGAVSATRNRRLEGRVPPRTPRLPPPAIKGRKIRSRSLSLLTGPFAKRGFLFSLICGLPTVASTIYSRLPGAPTP